MSPHSDNHHAPATIIIVTTELISAFGAIVVGILTALGGVLVSLRHRDLQDDARVRNERDRLRIEIDGLYGYITALRRVLIAAGIDAPPMPLTDEEKLRRDGD